MEGEPTQLCYQQKIQLLPFLPSMSSWEALNGQKYSVYYMFFLCIFLFNLQEESIKFVWHVLLVLISLFCTTERKKNRKRVELHNWDD